MYKEETGTAAYPFGPEMVYEAAASYVLTEETLYAVLHLPLLGEAFIYYVQEDFLLILMSGPSPIFLRAKDEAYLAVTEDDRYYLLLTEKELASCHVLGATQVCAGEVLRTRSTDGCLPALYHGEDGAVRQHCQEVSVQVPWVLSGGGGLPSAALLVNFRAPFVCDAMCKRHQATVGLAAWSILLSAGTEMQHRS